MAAMMCNRLRSFLSLRSGRMMTTMREAEDFLRGGSTHLEKCAFKFEGIQEVARRAVENQNGQQKNKKLELVEVVKGEYVPVPGAVENLCLTLKVKDEQGNHHLLDTEVWENPDLEDLQLENKGLKPMSDGPQYAPYPLPTNELPLCSFLNLRSGRMMRDPLCGGSKPLGKFVLKYGGIKELARGAVENHNGQQKNKKLELVEVVKGEVVPCAGEKFCLTVKVKDEKGNHHLFYTEVWRKPKLQIEYNGLKPMSDGPQYAPYPLPTN